MRQAKLAHRVATPTTQKKPDHDRAVPDGDSPPAPPVMPPGTVKPARRPRAAVDSDRPAFRQGVRTGGGSHAADIMTTRPDLVPKEYYVAQNITVGYLFVAEG